MKCPNCRCEIGNQPVCPYCGKVIVLPKQKSVYEMQTTPVQSPSIQSMLNRIYRHINNLEIRNKLIVVLMAGMFALQILTLLICLVK